MEINEFRFYGGSRACFIEWGEDVTCNGGMRCCFVNDGWCTKGFFKVFFEIKKGWVICLKNGL